MSNEKHSFGAIFSPKDIRDYKGVAYATAQVFPEEFELELPEVKDQGYVGSCVAHALSILVEYHSRLYADDMRKMSVGYIYGNRRNSTHTGTGMVTRDAIQAVCKYGDVPQIMFPYNDEVPEAITKFERVADEYLADSYPNRFTSFYMLNSEADIKASLMQDGPVVMAMEWYSDIEFDKDVIMRTQMKSSSSAHCMVIYGWNKTGWKVRNSWGDWWGNKGNCVIPYEVVIREFWGVVDNYSENKNKKLIEKLYAEIEQLNAQINTQQDIIKDLQTTVNSLTEKASLSDEQKRQLDEALKTITEANKTITDLQIELNNKLNEIELLNQELLDVKKPFNSALGQIVAKVVNWIISTFNWWKGKFRVWFNKK